MPFSLLDWHNPATMCGQNQNWQPWSNLKQPIPLWRKLQLVVRNNFIKLRARKGCCGNFNEPGC
ncbi:MAG TPA: hypothetical protein EYG27_07925 [Dehalococcoidia bacterium]|nr:hypothetical protein [Dehalococcoidia bacterium]